MFICFAAHKDYLIYKRWLPKDPIVIQQLQPDFSLGESRQIETYDPDIPNVSSKL